MNLVDSLPGEERERSAVFDVEAGLHGTEGDLTVSVGLDDHHGRLEQVQVFAVPDVGLADLPATDQQALHRDRHCRTSARSLVNPTGL